MPHTHPVIDNDLYFSIDALTREISNGSKKVKLMQGDHASEVFTFEIPRYIDGHDMSLCNKIAVHYLNVGTSGSNADANSITDAAINDTEDKVIFSWTIYRTATKYAGTLNFLIKFSCVEEDGTISYQWNSDIFKGITISAGMDNEETIIEDHYDILQTWRNEIVSEMRSEIAPLRTGITRVESLDTENIVQLRDLETGLYVLYGYFSPYTDSHMTMTFDNTMVVVTKKTEGSHLLVFTGTNSKVNFLQIMADGEAPAGYTYTRTDFVMLDMHNLIEKVGELADLNTEEKSSIVAAINEINQLKDDISAITPDDSAVDGKPWTSEKIVEALCPPFETTGSIVQCHPVEHYPLGVVSRIDATQSGTGDASPDNIRPIVGWDSVHLNRCGKNLFNKGDVSFKQYTEISTNYPAGDYVLSAETEVEAEHNTVQIGYCVDGLWKYTMKNIDNRWNHNINASIGITGFRFYADTSPANNMNCIYKNIQLEIGSTATPYEPYTGDTYTAELPETIYGGELDWNTGVLTVDTAYLAFNGDEAWKIYSTFILLDGNIRANEIKEGKCSHFVYKHDYGAECIFAESTKIWIGKALAEKYSSIDEWKAYLAAQYAAGTPVQLCYKLETPYTVQLTPQQIAALTGINTLYTDSGDTVVSGRADPVWLTQSLIERIAALESAATNI